MTLKSAKTQRLELLFSALAGLGLTGPIGSASPFFLSNHLPDNCLGEPHIHFRQALYFTPDRTEKPGTTICDDLSTALSLIGLRTSTRMNPEMDDDRSSSTPTAASKSVSGQDKEKPRLTDQEKKNNHIASEQKRRAAIREGFDRLTELVPGLEGQGRSESIVLQKTVDFIHLQLQERHNLIAEIENKGGRVDDSFRPT
ncbi:hypothetical protein N7509_011051 [Penicillium cosmopolitanum]|uniref:BHLH domain-containing protein n=2 Tax=Penicillium TaxID=5073 RepID=A0A9W9VSU6_9EURO|nr:uncharacterized protein N7509_011051 [Penicillium cosmopolitanum]KAJ5388510.1 hypothetical protein N7509_011051 [Penicillium cosmopolitanum]